MWPANCQSEHTSMTKLTDITHCEGLHAYVGPAESFAMSCPRHRRKPCT